MPAEKIATADAEPNNLLKKGLSSPPTWLLWGLVVLLLALHWALGFTATLNKSLTYDEGAHLFSGVVYWLRGDYRFQCENGNLPQHWCAIPAIVLGQTKLPDENLRFWQDAHPRDGAMSYLYDSHNNATLAIRAGRAWSALWGVAICLAVFCWSKKLYGWAGGLVSLLTCAGCPTLLANAPLMTSDACVTLFFLLSVAALWRVLHRVTWLTVFCAAGSLAGLFLAKNSAILIFPMASLLVLVRLQSAAPWPVNLGRFEQSFHTLRQKLTLLLALVFVCGCSTWSAVWLAYGCRFSGVPLAVTTSATAESPREFLKFGTLEKVSEKLSPKMARVIRGLAAYRALPEAYLYGIAYVAAHAERLAFLNGEFSLSGFRLYFPYSFLVKTPLGMIGLLVVASGLFSRATRALPPPNAPPASTAKTSPPPLPPDVSTARWYSLTPLLVLFAVYALVAINSSLNIGHRHLLPIYPALHILLGASAVWLMQKTWQKWLVGGLLLAALIEPLAAWPHYLAFFNPLVPRATAHRHLVESSLDWGQDLPGLSDWLAQHNRRSDKYPLDPDGPQPVYFAYFGFDRPLAYGVRAIRIPEETTNSQLPLRYEAGIYCISATTLEGVYTSRPGPWSEQHEATFQLLKTQIASWKIPNPPPVAERQATIQALERARFLRLLAYLRHRPEDAQIGGSILIYRLTEPELTTALEGPPAELVSLPLMDRLRQEKAAHAARSRSRIQNQTPSQTLPEGGFRP